jgi:hypothetical protein
MRFLTAVFLYVALLSPISLLEAADYYVSPSGDDGNAGSLAKPWKTIAKINATKFAPGDRVLFEGGQVFKGNAAFDAGDAGTAQRPVIVGSYGKGRATIEAGNGVAILIENAGGFVIRDLLVRGADRIKNKSSGVHVVNRLPRTTKLEYIRMDNVEAADFGYAGIMVQGDAPDKTQSGYNDVRITRCAAHGNAYYGIYVTGVWDSTATDYAHSNVYVGYCRAYDNPGDPTFLENHSGNGILIDYIDGGVMEWCVAYNNGYLCDSKKGGPVGLWTHASNNILIQYNEAYNNRTGKSVDGGGFDFDGGVSNSILQYNYSHDNDGAGYLLYVYPGAPYTFRKNVCRYNISVNDGRKNHYGGIWLGNDGSGVRDLEIYNNTVVIAPQAGATPKAIHVRDTVNVRFRNNLLVSTGGVPILDVPKDQPGLRFQGNNYWAADGKPRIQWEGRTYESLDAWRAATGQETVNGLPTGLSVDPRLSDLEEGVTLGDALLLPALRSYRLLPDSPLVDAGLDLRKLFGLSVGANDLWRNPIPQGRGYDIGAHEAP